MLLVDSSVWIEYFNGNESAHTDYLDSILGTEPVGIADLILTEVLQGFRSDKEYETAKELLLELTLFNVLGVDRAIKAAENYRTLRKKGITIRKTADTLIATFCIEQKYPLLFTDKDFIPFSEHLGLQSALSTA